MKIIENPAQKYLNSLQKMLAKELDVGIYDIHAIVAPLYIVAEENGSALGVATVSQTGSCPELHKLYVAPLYRQRGVGRQLVEYAISLFTAKGAQELCVEMTEQSRSFWERTVANRKLEWIDSNKFSIILS
ncbi:GNAT family N-acetyltransferase [Burkholderia gladioli]|uniref:GNAT family N-acetyltransferase n=1 Tax=Burkholderia gladioli TaxID=28095 RepID=UPI001640DD03|nr:GNAT family N-acetyltransferase [Burkholderia gladioli]MDC6133032.1 GNAT family N-acetyltransferase [Burkholderia gladioli]